MKYVRKLVKKNDEIWGEIHGAGQYTTDAQAAKESGDRDEAEAYLYMAGQELEHGDRLKNLARTMLDKARREGHDNMDMLEEMWTAMVERHEEELCHVKKRMEQARK